MVYDDLGTGKGITARERQIESKAMSKTRSKAKPAIR